MRAPWLHIALLVFAMVMTFAIAAHAAELPFALGEVAAPPEATGIDHATLRTTAQNELSAVDTTRVKATKRRPVVVSVAITSATDASKACTVNALVRDAKSGVMIAVLQGRASAEGAGSPDVRKAVLRAAMRSAVTQIPDALSAQ
ncbi:MAG: hypothetical protein JST00_43075 [Deltaproteobacteria bacterium]|nr:hypothetical protein [Deltaproteobacteria bacterium]